MLIACSDIPELHPHVADFELNESREYKVIDKKKFIVKFKKTHDLKRIHNMWCLPPEDMAALKDYWERKQGDQ